MSENVEFAAHTCENCGSNHVNVTLYKDLTEQTVFHCQDCGYIHWK